MKRIGVLTSGGDAPGMNAAIRSVVRTGMQLGMSIVGFKRGYNGLLMRSDNERDDFEILTSRSVSDKVHRGGTFLMTARCAEFLDVVYQKRAIENLRALGIEGLIAIGGDGTYKGAKDLQDLGFPCVSVPGTIDNDLGYTDFTIGFDTAVNTACEAVNRIRDTSDSHERVSLITVMGRNCGDIALYTAVACGAELYMIPETPWSIEEIAERVKWGVLRGKRSMMMVFAEGAVKSLTSDVSKIIESHPKLQDMSAHKLSSSQVAQIIEALSGHETRATVLGYTQRGGSPSARDRVLATRMGAYAAELLVNDVSGVAVGVRGDKMVNVPFADVPKGHQGEIDDMDHLIDLMSFMAGS